MSDIIERVEYAMKMWKRHSSFGFENTYVSELLVELVAELKAERVMRAETQRQLSEFIVDFCALRDALPLEQVKQILWKRTAK